MSRLRSCHHATAVVAAASASRMLIGVQFHAWEGYPEMSEYGEIARIHFGSLSRSPIRVSARQPPRTAQPRLAARRRRPYSTAATPRTAQIAGSQDQAATTDLQGSDPRPAPYPRANPTPAMLISAADESSANAAIGPIQRRRDTAVASIISARPDSSSEAEDAISEIP